MKSKDEMFKEMNDSRIKLGLLPIKRGKFDKTFMENKMFKEMNDKHNWFDKPPHENTRCFRCGIKYGYWREWVNKGYSQRVRCFASKAIK